MNGIGYIKLGDPIIDSIYEALSEDISKTDLDQINIESCRISLNNLNNKTIEFDLVYMTICKHYTIEEKISMLSCSSTNNGDEIINTIVNDITLIKLEEMEL